MKYILFLFILFASCSPKLTSTTSNTVTRDSLAIKVVHHRDTVRIPGEQVIVTKIIHDTVSFRVEEKTKRADIIVINKKGVLTATCKCDSLQLAFDRLQKDTTRYKFVTRTVVKTFTEHKASAFDWFCRGVVFLLVLIIAAIILHKTGILKIPFI